MNEFTVSGRSSVDKQTADGFTTQIHIKWQTYAPASDGDPPYLTLALSAGGDTLWCARAAIGDRDGGGTAAPTIAAAAAVLIAQLGDYLDELGKTTRGLALTLLDGTVGIGARL